MVSAEDDADVKIADFGFAAVVHGSTLTNQCGTPGYIAPEILLGKPHGRFCGCSSRGCIVYVCMVVVVLVIIYSVCGCVYSIV